MMMIKFKRISNILCTVDSVEFELPLGETTTSFAVFNYFSWALESFDYDYSVVFDIRSLRSN